MAVFTQTATGAAVVAVTATPSNAAALDLVSVHLSAAGGGGDLTVTLDAAAGAVYDVVLLTQDMTAVTNLLWQPDRPIELAPGDKVVVAWANAGTKTYGILVKWSGR